MAETARRRAADGPASPGAGGHGGRAAAGKQGGSGTEKAPAARTQAGDGTANGAGGHAASGTVNRADVLKVPEIVVTPTRFAIPAGEVGSSISVLTASEIERLQTPSVIDALRSLPGLAITRSGGPGTTSLVRMRGADEGGTMVLFDGIKMNDPADARGASVATAPVAGLVALRVDIGSEAGPPKVGPVPAFA